ncbi:unnamed protein product [Rotaria sordida]|uniref:Uncharacterized protein n=1 Tax=Rotaria sordida TaxID=392033 RepID=A0A814IPV4_9BILA|nr:unnamed protein product [Rotaria sordida]
MNLDYTNPSTGMFGRIRIKISSFYFSGVLPLNSISAELPLYSKSLEIIAQPCYTSKLRYRSDYEHNKNRRGVLHSTNNSNYQSPTIRIPHEYLDITEQYFVRICLVTVINERTNRRYIHPYDLEDIDNEDHNDRYQRSIWFPIQGEDIGGIKSFPNLRVVKKKADNLKNHGNFLVFDSPNEDSSPQLPSVKDTIKEFNLEKAQLAFTIGKKAMENNNVTFIVFNRTTVFSEEMPENISRESDLDDVPSVPTIVRSHPLSPSECRMYKYAPRSGFTDSNDEILIFYTSKLKLKKYGELQVMFEFDGSTDHWSTSVLDLDVKDQMVSFRTPYFPLSINRTTTVNIILKQEKRVLEPLTFNYIPRAQCPTCQGNLMGNPTSIIQNTPNKRHISVLYSDNEETDDGRSVCETNPEIKKSYSEPDN